MSGCYAVHRNSLISSMDLVLLLLLIVLNAVFAMSDGRGLFAQSPTSADGR